MLREVIRLSVFLMVFGCAREFNETAAVSRGDDSLLAACSVVPACNAAPPSLSQLGRFTGRKPWGKAYHGGHDLYLQEDQDQWLVGSFSYGNLLHREPLRGEAVDIYLLRSCGDEWEKLGTAFTSRSYGENPNIDGVEDKGGSVFFRVPTEKKLEVGRHRVRLVVQGDQTATELFVEVLKPETPLFVSDVDGTLTTSELEELGKLVFGQKTPEANFYAADIFKILVEKGYRPYYLTARPGFLVQRTRQFLAERGFPAGAVRTSGAPLIGLTGTRATQFKAEALERLHESGFQVDLGFGNTATDAAAYEKASIPIDKRFYFRFEDPWGGRMIDSYEDLKDLKELPSACESSKIAG